MSTLYPHRDGIALEPVGNHDTDPFASQDDEIVPDEERRVFACPSCAGANITLQGRCVVCTDCGWSSCVL